MSFFTISSSAISFSSTISLGTSVSSPQDNIAKDRASNVIKLK